MMRIFLLGLFVVGSTAFANGSGAIGYSGAPPGNQNCNGCHSGGSAPTVAITGPTTLGAGATATYTFTVSGGAGVRAGMNVSVSDPNAALNPISSSVSAVFGELSQKAPVAFPASFQFSMTAPPFPGTVKIYASGNSTNGNGSTSGDLSSSTSLSVTITAGSGMNPPAITAAASAMSNPVRTRSVQVTVGANDDGMESNLSYTWTATGPTPVAFTPNGNNAAKSSLAQFSSGGMYALTVTVRDGTNKTVTSTLMLPVEATYSLLRLTPVSAQVAPGATLQYAATARDQFDAPLVPQPAIAFSVPAGGGTISAAGLLKAQNGVGEGFVAVATSMGKSASASFAVGKPASMPADTIPPTVALVSPSTAGTRLDNALKLEATANDDTGVAEVRFEVAQITVATVTAGPPWNATYMTKSGLPGGLQALEAVAKDIAGNETRSTSIPVEVPAPPIVDAGGPGGGAGGGTGGVGGGAGGGSAGGQGCSCASAPVGFALLALAFAWRRRSSRG